MIGIMNENVVVREFELDKPLDHKIDSVLDNCIRDCRNKYFHTFDHICVNDIKLTKFGNIELFNLTVSCKSMSLYDFNKKITVARQTGFLINQINELTIKIYSNLSNINSRYYLKHRTPIMHRHFFKIFSQNPE